MPADRSSDLRQSRAGSAARRVPPFAGQEVLCRPLGFFFTELKRQGHSPDLLCEGIAHSRERLTDKHGRIDWESFRRLLSNLGRFWSEEQLVNAGRALARSRWVQPFGVVARLLLSCDELYHWTTDPGTGASRQNCTCLRNDLRKVGPQRIEISASMDPGYAASPELYLILKGALAAMPRSLGLPEARVEMVRLGDTAVYTVDLPDEKGVIPRLRRWVSWPMAGRAAARELKETSQQLFERIDELSSESHGRASAEAALGESEKRFSKIFHAAPTPMLISSLKGGLIDVNRRFLQLVGRSRRELIGRQAPEFEIWKDADQRDRLLDQLRQGLSVQEVESEYFGRDRQVRVSLISAERITLEGEPCAIWQILDITERKLAEQENRRLQERVLRAQKLESLGVMAGGIAHDFNNLLLGILGNAERAAEEIGSDDRTARESIEAVLTASHHAARLTRQMLAYAGKGRLEREPVNLADAMGSTQHLLRSGQSKNKSLDCLVEGDDELWVEGDQAQIRQVLMNLFTNAAESYGDQPGTVVARIRKLTVDANRLAQSVFGEEISPGDYACVEVRDSGCGMDRQVIEKIFDPFFTTKFAGRGLGLAATLGIVRSHGGALTVDSAPGQGTTFRVLLPLAIPARARTEPLGPEHRAAADGSILIVDDEDAVRSVVRSMLERAGYRTLTAEGGSRALQLLREHGADVVAVVLDLTMPDMSGEDTFQELRRIREDLPIVCCSGYGESIGLQWVEGKTGVDFVAKPFTKQMICRSLQRLL